MAWAWSILLFSRMTNLCRRLMHSPRISGASHAVLTTTGFAVGQNSRRSATTRLNAPHPGRLRKLSLLQMLQPNTSPPAKAAPALRQQITGMKPLVVSLAMIDQHSDS